MALEEIIELLVRVQDTVRVKLEEVALNCSVLSWGCRRKKGSWGRRSRWGGARSAGRAPPGAAVPMVLSDSSLQGSCGQDKSGFRGPEVRKITILKKSGKSQEMGLE